MGRREYLFIYLYSTKYVLDAFWLIVSLIPAMLYPSIGMAFGTGSAVARRAVDAIMGPRTIQHETVGESAAAPAAAAPSLGGSEACGPHNKAFQDVSTSLFHLFLSKSPSNTQMRTNNYFSLGCKCINLKGFVSIERTLFII